MDPQSPPENLCNFFTSNGSVNAIPSFSVINLFSFKYSIISSYRSSLISELEFLSK